MSRFWHRLYYSQTIMTISHAALTTSRTRYEISHLFFLLCTSLSLSLSLSVNLSVVCVSMCVCGDVCVCLCLCVCVSYVCVCFETWKILLGVKTQTVTSANNSMITANPSTLCGQTLLIGFALLSHRNLKAHVNKC